MAAVPANAGLTARRPNIVTAAAPFIVGARSIVDMIADRAVAWLIAIFVVVCAWVVQSGTMTVGVLVVLIFELIFAAIIKIDAALPTMR